MAVQYRLLYRDHLCDPGGEREGGEGERGEVTLNCTCVHSGIIQTEGMEICYRLMWQDYRVIAYIQENMHATACKFASGKSLDHGGAVLHAKVALTDNGHN